MCVACLALHGMHDVLHCCTLTMLDQAPAPRTEGLVAVKSGQGGAAVQCLAEGPYTEQHSARTSAASALCMCVCVFVCPCLENRRLSLSVAGRGVWCAGGPCWVQQKRRHTEYRSCSVCVCMCSSRL